MNLLQRIRSPFTGTAEDPAAQMRARQHFVGSELRERREEYGLDLDSVGETLRIKPSYLAAIEQGRPQDLPGPAYALGFVRAYAQYLGLDADEILESFKAESIDAQPRPDLALPMPLGARSVPTGAILIVGLILALCGYGTWYYLSTGERNRPERVAAVPAELQQTLRGAPPVAPPGGAGSDAAGGRFGSGIFAPNESGGPPPVPPPPATAANPASAAPPAAPAATSATPPAASAGNSAAPKQPAPSAAPAPTQPPATAAANPTVGRQAVATPPPAAPPAQPPAATPASTPPAEAAKPGGGRVEIRATADCWIQVRAASDQTIVFSRVLKAGETYPVPRDGLFLRTGNAGVLTIMVDGKPAPPIGGVGTLRRNVSLDPEPLVAGKAVKD